MPEQRPKRSGNGLEMEEGRACRWRVCKAPLPRRNVVTDKFPHVAGVGWARTWPESGDARVVGRRWSSSSQGVFNELVLWIPCMQWAGRELGWLTWSDDCSAMMVLTALCRKDQRTELCEILPVSFSDVPTHTGLRRKDLYWHQTFMTWPRTDTQAFGDPDI